MTTEYTENFNQLKQIFPNVEDDVIADVLYSQAGNVRSSCDVLIQINDPNYKPSRDEADRLKEIEEDEALARHLAESELHHANQQHRQQQWQQQRQMARRYPAGYPSHNLRVMPPPVNRRASGSAPVSPAATQGKKSKLRDIFRFKRSRSGSHGDTPANAIGGGNSRVSESEPPAMQPVRPQTLESDFSDDDDDEGSASRRRGSDRPQSRSSRRSQTCVDSLQAEAAAQPQQPGNDVFGLFDDTNLASYTPLSPSKKEKVAVARQDQVDAAVVPADNAPSSLVDLDHPFDVNPLLHSSGPATPAGPTAHNGQAALNGPAALNGSAHNISPPLSPTTNPFAAASAVNPPYPQQDTNPFRNRLAD
ncbi:hypothetical protein IWW36_001819 [Coemansia brasiliensis]|uniref:CUE domain-containing protein n=1 Tax=Coemansia brasiliensis TaxID=2650707 RepID=A0A9W8IEM5_9FUNG|nr:hypothetical protein IWW36_001819 [Coemansia brasiliensis]